MEEEYSTHSVSLVDELSPPLKHCGCLPTIDELWNMSAYERHCHFCTLTPALPTVTVYLYLYCPQSLYTHTCAAHIHCIVTYVLSTVTVYIHLYCPQSLYTNNNHRILIPVMPTVTVYSHPYCPHSLYTHTYTAHIHCILTHILPTFTVCIHLYCP